MYAVGGLSEADPPTDRKGLRHIFHEKRAFMIHAPSVIRHLAVAATGILAMVCLTGSWLVPPLWAVSSINGYLDWYRWAQVSGCLNPVIDTLSAIREQAPLV